MAEAIRATEAKVDCRPAMYSHLHEEIVRWSTGCRTEELEPRAYFWYAPGTDSVVAVGWIWIGGRGYSTRIADSVSVQLSNHLGARSVCHSTVGADTSVVERWSWLGPGYTVKLQVTDLDAGLFAVRLEAESGRPPCDRLRDWPVFPS